MRSPLARPRGGLRAVCGPLRLSGLAGPPRRPGPPSGLLRAPLLQARVTYETQYTRRCFAARYGCADLPTPKCLWASGGTEVPTVPWSIVLPSSPRGAETPFGSLGCVPGGSSVRRRSAGRLLRPTCRSVLPFGAEAPDGFSVQHARAGFPDESVPPLRTVCRRLPLSAEAASCSSGTVMPRWWRVLPAPRCWNQAMRHRSVASSANRREAEASLCFAPGSRPPRWTSAACRLDDAAPRRFVASLPAGPKSSWLGPGGEPPSFWAPAPAAVPAEARPVWGAF